ncbi:MAG: hypothetical protein GYA51_02900 [Candidatus Methanofastidiosa archaeon]|nr:hypothetical protein [Candidatus Methanofastidiosa archaeon]
MKKFAFLFMISITLLLSCEKIEDTTPTPPPAPANLEFTLAVTNVSIFDGNDGKITVNITTGNPPYSYQLGTNPSQSSNVFSGLVAGTYNVTVTDSKQKTLTKSAQVTQPAITPLSFTLSATNVSAWGLSDGKITVTVSSGMAPYTYTVGQTTNTTGIFTGLIAGSYDVVVTDNKQQTGTKSITITQPPRVPVYTKDLIDFTSSSYNKEAISTEVSAYANLLNGTEKFTISFWYNTTNTTSPNKNTAITTARLLSSTNTSQPSLTSDTWIDINTNWIAYGRAKANSFTKDEIRLTSTTAWSGLHHIVVLFDGSKMKMYIDNVLINEVASSINLNINKIYLGGACSNTNYEYNGIMSKIKIYNAAITPEEVDYLFKNK